MNALFPESIKHADWRALLTNLAITRSLALEIAVRAIDSQECERGQVLRRAYAIVENPPPFILGNTTQWQRLLWLRKLGDFFQHEVYQRTQGHPAAEVLCRTLISTWDDGAEVRSLAPPEDTLVRALKVENISVYQQRSEYLQSTDEQHDLQHTAIHGLLKTYAGLGEIYAAGVPARLNLPVRRTLGLAGLPDRGWDWPLFHRNKVYRVLVGFGPLAQLDALVGAGHHALRAQWSEEGALKRRPPDGLRFDDLVGDAFADWNDARDPETLAAERQEKQQSREKIRRALERRGGAKAVKYFDARLQDLSSGEAAVYVGISKRQAARYEETVKKLLLDPPK